MEPKENDKNYRTFLNIEMGATWKGIVSFILTLVFSYPILRLHLGPSEMDNSIDYYIIIPIVSIGYWIIYIMVWMIFLYTLSSVWKEKKMYHLAALITSSATLIISLLK